MPTPRAVKRADGTLRWRVQFREKPGSTPTSETFDTPEAAEAFIRAGEELGWIEARRVRHHGTAGPATIPTLATWFETHLELLSASVTPGTVDGYRREARRTWMPRLGRYPLDMISRDMVVAWVAWQRRQETAASRHAREKAIAAGQTPPPPRTIAPKTINNAQRLLSTVMASAAERYPITNVARGVPLPTDAEPAEMVVLTRDEFAAVHAAHPKQWQPLIALLAGTGMRWGEATALRGRDVDLDGEVPSVRVARAWKRGEGGSSYLGSPKSRAGRRTISLSPSTVAAIRATVENAAPDDLLFTGQTGGKISNHFRERVWAKAVRSSGISKRPRLHDLRHSHASWLIHQGVPLPVIQQRLGHESIEVTVGTYGHILPDAAMVAAAAVERAMGEFGPGLVHVGELVAPDGVR